MKKRTEKLITPDLLNHVTIPSKELGSLYGDIVKEVILKRYTFPKRKSSDGYYHINLPDETKKSGRTQIKASTLEILRNKVLAFEYQKVMKGKKTFKECYELQKERRLKRVKSESRKVSVNNTIRKDDYEYGRYFSGTWIEEQFVDEITSKDIEKAYEENLLKFDVKRKSAANMRVILSKVFTYAYSEGFIETNVYDKCNFLQFQDMIVDDVPIAKRVYSAEEVKKILEYTRNKEKSDPKYIPSYALEMQILMGARRGEIPPLTWSDVLEDKIWIHKEQLNTYKKSADDKNGFAIVDHTKTGVERFFPITKELRELLKKLKFVHDKYYPDSEFLFPGSSKNGCITNNVAYQFYRRACDGMGIKNTPGITRGTHSFRRNAITSMVNKSGGNLVLASKLYGNSPRTAERNYYTGIDLGEALEYLEK